MVMSTCTVLFYNNLLTDVAAWVLIVPVQVLKLESGWLHQRCRDWLQTEMGICPPLPTCPGGTPMCSTSLTHSCCCHCHFCHKSDRRSWPSCLLKAPQRPILLQFRFPCDWSTALVVCVCVCVCVCARVCARAHALDLRKRRLLLAHSLPSAVPFDLTCKIQAQNKVISRQGNKHQTNHRALLGT